MGTGDRKQRKGVFTDRFLCRVLGVGGQVELWSSVPAFSLQGATPEQRATHADSYRRIGGL